MKANSLPRPALCGLPLSKPLIMGVLNITPDSFSDGGAYASADEAARTALQMVEDGADIIDIGGESTRPGAQFVPEEEELRRVAPVLEKLQAVGCKAVISIDTRKAAVAEIALTLGATLFNDVSALSYDPRSAGVAAAYARSGGAVCLMHAQGDPKTMQDAPSYADVAQEVTAFLAERMAAAQSAGVAQEAILLDPGVGFGKTLDHNLALIRRLDALKALGAPVLLGVSRKRFIGALSGAARADERMPGSVAAALYGVSRGANVLRVHDVSETAQALSVWNALSDPKADLNSSHGDAG